jgi:hypothetical protein
MHAPKMAASEAAEMHAAKMAASEAAEVTAAEMTASEATEVTASEMTASEAAEVTASAKATAPKGKGFAHYTRPERSFETEPERDRRCENFCHSTRHRAPFPLHLRKL